MLGNEEWWFFLIRMIKYIRKPSENLAAESKRLHEKNVIILLSRANHRQLTWTSLSFLLLILGNEGISLKWKDLKYIRILNKSLYTIESRMLPSQKTIVSLYH